MAYRDDPPRPRMRVAPLARTPWHEPLTRPERRPEGSLYAGPARAGPAYNGACAGSRPLDVETVPGVIDRVTDAERGGARQGPQARSALEGLARRASQGARSTRTWDRRATRATRSGRVRGRVAAPRHRAGRAPA